MLIKTNEKSLRKATARGKHFLDAYLFVRELAATDHQHPILLDFNANRTLHRQRLGLTDHKFRSLLNLAVRLKLAYFEGKHLRLRSHTADKREFKAKNKIFVQSYNIKPYAYYTTITHYLKQQHRAIKYYSSTVSESQAVKVEPTSFMPHVQLPINHNVTLSVRKCATLLQVSIGTAQHLLTKVLPAFGLTLTQNRVQISMDTFKYYLSRGSYNIRYSDNEYSYVQASSAKWSGFKGKPVSNPNKRSTYSYCAIDLV